MFNWSEQNLPWANPNQQTWAKSPGNLAVVVKAVFYDARGHPFVNCESVRFGLAFTSVPSQTPSPKVGEMGFVGFMDGGRRDLPFYVGLMTDFAPRTVKVVRGAPDRSTPVETVDVEDQTTHRKTVNVPFLVEAAGSFPVVPGSGGSGSYQGPYPMAGDVGLLFYRDGRTDRPVYVGRLSTLPKGG